MLNKVLGNEDRIKYEKLIKRMGELSPEMVNRKIPESMVQQAFMLETVGKEIEMGHGSSILCVGSFEDTAYDCLTRQGIVVTAIDPDINMDLHTFMDSDYRNKRLFDIVFSTSVIEHVENDQQFVKDICDLLVVGGLGVLTCDFNNGYKIGDKLPYSDLRFYTEADLWVRLRLTIETSGCELVDEPNWVGEPDFTHDGCDYSFATLVFRKVK